MKSAPCRALCEEGLSENMSNKREKILVGHKVGTRPAREARERDI